MRIVFRVDATPEIGTGHLMRCLVLADRARDRGATTLFISRSLSGHLAEIVVRHGHELVEFGPNEVPGRGSGRHGDWLTTTQEQDAAETLDALGPSTCDWLVVDHYGIGLVWESRIRSRVGAILAIDDLADRDHDCDVLLDQNLDPGIELAYADRVPAHCVKLLGPRYALLRPEFAAARTACRRDGAPVERLLVFFSGLDEAGATLSALEAVREVQSRRRLQVDVIIGAGNAHVTTIEQLCSAWGYTLHVQTTRMAEIMVGAGLAIGAGGVTTWERACVGLPTIAFAQSFNQAAQVTNAAEWGALIAPDADVSSRAAVAAHVETALGNAPIRVMMARRGMELVDGLGADRVVRRMGLSRIVMRKAEWKDVENLREWRNHPDIRLRSRSTRVIGTDEHRTWFKSVLGSQDVHLLIGEMGGQPAGVVRFDVKGASAEVSIYVVPGQGGRGLGLDLLAASERWLCVAWPEVKMIEAEVLRDNAASHHLFKAAGFGLDRAGYTKNIRGVEPYHADK